MSEMEQAQRAANAGREHLEAVMAEYDDKPSAVSYDRKMRAWMSYVDLRLNLLMVSGVELAKRGQEINARLAALEARGRRL